jgi:hypothetical protein
MSYTPFVWAATTDITAHKLNHIETQYDQAYTDLLLNHTHATRYFSKPEADSRYFWAAHQGISGDADADSLDTHHATEVIGKSLPIGAIIMWTKPSASIPTGWHLCDGSTVGGYTTVDLRDSFVNCAGGTFNPGDTCGNATVQPLVDEIIIGTHTLTEAELPSHAHDVHDLYGDGTIVAWTGGTASPHAHNVTHTNVDTSTDGGTGGSHTHTTGSSVTYNVEGNLPEYYAVYFIERVS